VTGDSNFAIKVKLIFFGPLAEHIGEREIEVIVSHGSTVLDLIDRFGLLGFIDSGLRIAIDGEIGAGLEEVLQDNSELALLPPVSGG
tara:strand:- start:14967 stop:15227 length:261 start_codon:yes stop_codon:yes gene_type:complete